MQTSDGPGLPLSEAPPTPGEPVAGHAVAEEHIHLPPPSIWPMTTAGGVALAGLGLVTSWPFIIAGLILMFSGVVYWVQELRHELR